MAWLPLVCTVAIYYTLHRLAFAMNTANLLMVDNMSAYPGEDASFVCRVNSSTSGNVMFQWTIFLLDGTNDTVTLPADTDNSDAGSTSSITHYSTYNIANVNYTNNGIGLQCNIAGDTILIAQLTVLTPVVILTMPSSLISLQVGEPINLTCTALGGPRLVLSWLKDDNEIARGQMGMDVISFALNTTEHCDFGNYTCVATIDDMQEFYSVLVAPNTVRSSENDRSCEPAVITLTIFLVITIIGLIISVAINIIQRRSKKYNFTKSDTANTEIKLSTIQMDSKSNLMPEPIYEGIAACTIESEPDYVGMRESDYVGVNMNTEPDYEIEDIIGPQQEPEYEAITAYRRQEDVMPPNAIYVNTLERTTPHCAN